MNTVTYTLENGTKIVQPITAESLVGERGRKRTEGDMHKLFKETAWDKRAVSYKVDSETNEEQVNEKEIHFSKLDKKLAKAQHKEFVKSNPDGFKKETKEFQKQLVDIVTKKRRINMNIKSIDLK